MIKTPFTPEQVAELNAHQQNDNVHPYTCSGQGIPECKRSQASQARQRGETIPYSDENEGVLTATEAGWVCPCGKYTQNWAHTPPPTS